jgi:monoterpene epsilon-lactone hydrolase
MSPSRRHEFLAWAVPRTRGSRAAEAGWDLRYVERPGLIHVYPLLPVIPEAKDAWRQTQEFLG